MRLSIISVITGVLILAIGGGAVWYRYQKLVEGTSAYERSNFSTAFKDLEPYNGWGNTNAKYDLACMYLAEHGILEEDSSLSLNQVLAFLKSSAEEGNANAQFLFAEYLSGGPDRSDKKEIKDVTKSYMLYSLSAAHGDKEAVAAMKSLKDDLMGNIISDAESDASKWHVGTPFPQTSLADFAAQKVSFDSSDKTIIPHLKIWFSVNWAEDGKQNEAIFIKQVGTDSLADDDPQNCHACGAYISVETFQGIGSDQSKQENIANILSQEQVNFTEIGSWGDVQPAENDALPYGSPGRVRERQFSFGQGKHLILIPLMYYGQGITNGFYRALIWVENPSKKGSGKWIDAGDIPTYEDDLGFCSKDVSQGPPCYKWSSTTSIGQKDGKPVVIVAAKGQTLNDDDKIIPAPSAIYHFDGTGFST